MTGLAQAHDDLRPLMFSIAYRMLGSVAEAEDVVQDAFLKMHRALAEGTELDSPDAYATTVTTRLAIDTLRSARVRREEYVGPWLPEPLVPERAPDPASRFELEDSVSVAMLVLMESLSPVERAVFILRETLGYDYAEIAAVVGQSEATCRQHFSRAHKRLGAGPRFEASQERRDELAAAFLAAVQGGGLEDLGSCSPTTSSSTATAAARLRPSGTPMHGSVAVARFLLGLVRRGGPAGVSLQPTHANGGPAALTIGPDGALLGVLAIEVADGRIVALHNQINPDKLQHLGRVGDLNALMRGGTTHA